MTLLEQEESVKVKIAEISKIASEEAYEERKSSKHLGKRKRLSNASKTNLFNENANKRLKTGVSI